MFAGHSYYTHETFVLFQFTMGGELTEKERIFVRAVAMSRKRDGLQCHKNIHIHKAIIRASGKSIARSMYFETKKKKGKDLQENCLPREGRASFYVPSHFKATVLTGKDRLSRKNLQILESVFSQQTLSEIKGKLLDVLTGASSLKNNLDRQNAIKASMDEMKSIPSDIQFLKYNKGCLQGAGWHIDVYSVFATVIVILQDTELGGLEIEGVSIPQNLRAGDIVFLDPCVKHRVRMAIRDKNRVVVTFVF